MDMMIFKKVVLFFILVLFLCTSSISAKMLKLVIINSYDDMYFYTNKETEGMISELQKNKNYNSIIKEYYLKTNSEHIFTADRYYIADKILPTIEKYKPDGIFITDDEAFKFIGITLSENNKIYVIGLNENIEDYKKEYPLLKEENIVAYEENINLERVFDFFTASNFMPKKYYILYDNDFVSYYLMKNYEKELKNKYDIEIKKISSIQELRSFIVKTQNINDPSVYCIALKILKNEDTGKYVSSKDIVREFLFFNKTNLELGNSPEFAKYGFSLACGPDLKEMGKNVMKDFIKNTEHGEFHKNIQKSINNLYVNIKRLSELNLLYLSSNGIKYVDRIFDTYETK